MMTVLLEYINPPIMLLLIMHSAVPIPIDFVTHKMHIMILGFCINYSNNYYKLMTDDHMMLKSQGKVHES